MVGQQHGGTFKNGGVMGRKADRYALSLCDTVGVL